MDLVRGKDVDVALDILNNTHKRAASSVSKVIKSAYANAVNNFNMNGDKLYVAEIMASDSIKMKRYLPRARGSASGLVKRFANIYVTVKERN
ncbi:MAG: 50S ribosomal protein L22 [Mollicutes bacterium]|nr:50S ribosomal protein L22 [Mollicutes bacterium]